VFDDRLVDYVTAEECWELQATIVATSKALEAADVKSDGDNKNYPARWRKRTQDALETEIREEERSLVELKQKLAAARQNLL